MKTMLVAAITVKSLGMGSAAFADSEGRADANTQFTEIPSVIAGAPAQTARAAAAAQSGQAAQVYSGRSSHGTWLFPPIGKYLDQQAGG